jgi:hypothetical protein
MLNAFY